MLTFGITDSFSTTEYLLLENRAIPNLTELTFCFWMATTDLANYGTVLSYAVDGEDNELTFTDYGGFVLSVKGAKMQPFINTFEVFLQNLSDSNRASKVREARNINISASSSVEVFTQISRKKERPCRALPSTMPLLFRLPLKWEGVWFNQRFSCSILVSGPW